MTKKILIVSTVSRQLNLFEKGNVEVLNSLGIEIHFAANFSESYEFISNIPIFKHHFDIERFPFSFKNVKAYFQLKKIMSKEKYDIIHCHTPVGGVLARLAAKNLHLHNVIYTAHGFHFYKGAPLINNLLYYSIEKHMSKYTDTLLTMNREDYNNALSFFSKNVVYIPGIGIDIDIFKRNFSQEKKSSLRKELGIDEKDFVFLSIGELIKRKNHETTIRAFARVKNDNFKYVICGKGKLEAKLKSLAEKMGIEKQVFFIGYRNDIPSICKISDAFIFPSYQEGLPVSLMEAMASGLPVIASRIRGNMNLIDEGRGGFLVAPDNVDEYYDRIILLMESVSLREKMKSYNEIKINEFSRNIVNKIMKEVYKKYI